MQKYSHCGARLSFSDTGITIAAPVDEDDFGTTRRELNYPFDSTEFERSMQALDDEATFRGLSVKPE